MADKRQRWHWFKFQCQQCGTDSTATRKDARFCGVNCRSYWHKAHKLTEAPKPSRRASVAPSPAGAWPYQPRNTARHRGGKANFRFAQDPLCRLAGFWCTTPVEFPRSSWICTRLWHAYEGDGLSGCPPCNIWARRSSIASCNRSEPYRSRMSMSLRRIGSDTLTLFSA